MNENLNVTQPSSKGGVNSMMIAGIVAIVALAGFFLLRSNAQQTAGQNAAATDLDTTEEIVTASDIQRTSEQTEPGIAIDDSDLEGGTEEILGDVVVVSIEGGSFLYKPNEISVKKGQTVRIELNSKDMMHDFNIDELGVKMPIVKSGDTGTVEFVADTVGEFEFYCSVGQHRANGQVGTLIVTD